MARPPGLKLGLLLGLVLLAHAVALEWFARQREQLVLLPAMPPPMYTRLLKPKPPPAVVAAPAPEPAPRARPVVAIKPRPRASEPQPVAGQQAVAEAPAAPQAAAPIAQAPPAPEPPPVEWPEAVADAAQPAASAPDSAASAPGSAAPASMASGHPPKVPGPPAAASAPAMATGPEAVASAPAPAASAPKETIELATWPTDTRLTYQLGGSYRGGPLFGDARVSWQRQADRYEVRLHAAVRVLGRVVVSQTLASQGEVRADGLVPRAYEEYRPGKHRSAQFGDHVLALERGKTAKRPPAMQDTASQFVELGHRFATGRERLEVGHTVSFWMARPGSVDRWTYDIVGREIVQTPNFGDVEAYHLKPRPIANPRGNITAEMWFAPSLQYLPVRIKVLMGDDHLDLVVEQIEQR